MLSLTEKTRISESRPGKANILLACIISISLLLSASSASLAFAAAGVPAEKLKSLPLVKERSVSTFVASTGAPGQGVAVNVIFPEKPRFKEGAPLAVVVPGGDKASGLTFTMHAAQVGFAEVRFAFPGGGLKAFHSDGSWDNRGKASLEVLRDVLLFASGKKPDRKGRKIQDLVPTRLDSSNVGAVGWDNGANALLVAMSKYPMDLNFIKWVTFYESPVGALLSTGALGTTHELIVNSHYRQGSAATGRCTLDFSKLSYDPESFKDREALEKKGLTAIKGVLFFDENKNGVWEESTEFALPYSIEPGVEKQFYAPEIISAAISRKLFNARTGGLNSALNSPQGLALLTALKAREGQSGGGKRKGKKKKAGFASIIKDKFTERPPDFMTPGFEPGSQKKPDLLAGLGDALKPGAAANYTAPSELASLLQTTENGWPKSIAKLEEAEKFFELRDGSLYIKQLVIQYPDLLVTLVGTKIDHHQRQPDNPHIALHYNTWIGSKAPWVRLNPDPKYVGFVADMNPTNFVYNAPNATIDAHIIRKHLEQEGFIPDYIFVQAAICELADRVQTGNRDAQLATVLNDYMNEAVKHLKLEKLMKEAKDKVEKKTTSAKKPKKDDDFDGFDDMDD